jgi:hypothetical protein
MKEDKSAEKQFLEYLDRLLAGQEITPGDDVSEEVRSALQQARRMLAFRQEPSDAFRTELRHKLLRQIAAKQQAAAQPAMEPQSAWERKGGIFSALPALVAVAGSAVVVILIFVGIVWFAGRQAAAPTTTMAPTMPPPTQGYPVTLPANIIPPDVTFTAKTPLSNNDGEAAIYQIEKSEVTVDSVTELGQRLGFTGEAELSEDESKIVMTEGSGDEARQLTVWTASGAVEYGYASPEKLFPSIPPSLPSQSQAESIAYGFLQQAALLPADYHSLAAIEKDTTVAAGGGYSISREYLTAAPPQAAAPAPTAPSAPSAPSEQAAPSTTPEAPPYPAPTYWQVDFPYFVDSSQATGPGSKLEVDIGNKGEVVNMTWSWRPTSVQTTDMIISEERAFQNLINGKGSLEIPLDCRQVVVKDVQLKYWLDPPSEEQYYAVPVYEFTGTCLDKNGQTLEDFTGWSPALPTN